MKSSLLAKLGLAGMLLGTVVAAGAAVPASATASLPPTDHIYVYPCGPVPDFQLLEVTADGSTTAIGTGMNTMNGHCPSQPAWDWKTKKAYFVFEGKVYSTDVTTGVTTEGPATSGGGVSNYLLGSPNLAISPDGTAWVQGDCYVGTIDLATGVVTEPATQPNCDNNPAVYYIQPFAYNGFDSKLYAINADNTTNDGDPFPNQLSVMSQTTGAVTLGAGVTIPGYQDEAITDFYAMAFDSSGRGWMIFNDGNPTTSKLKSFDTATATMIDQGHVMYGAGTILTHSIFISSPTPTLPDTGAMSSSTLGLIASLGAGLIGVGALAFVLARRRAA